MFEIFTFWGVVSRERSENPKGSTLAQNLHKEEYERELPCQEAEASLRPTRQARKIRIRFPRNYLCYSKYTVEVYEGITRVVSQTPIAEALRDLCQALQRFAKE